MAFHGIPWGYFTRVLQAEETGTLSFGGLVLATRLVCKTFLYARLLTECKKLQCNQVIMQDFHAEGHIINRSFMQYIINIKVYNMLQI